MKEINNAQNRRYDNTMPVDQVNPPHREGLSGIHKSVKRTLLVIAGCVILLSLTSCNVQPKIEPVTPIVLTGIANESPITRVTKGTQVPEVLIHPGIPIASVCQPDQFEESEEDTVQVELGRQYQRNLVSSVADIQDTDNYKLQTGGRNFFQMDVNAEESDTPLEIEIFGSSGGIHKQLLYHYLPEGIKDSVIIPQVYVGDDQYDAIFVQVRVPGSDTLNTCSKYTISFHQASEPLEETPEITLPNQPASLSFGEESNIEISEAYQGQVAQVNIDPSETSTEQTVIFTNTSSSESICIRNISSEESRTTTHTVQPGHSIELSLDTSLASNQFFLTRAVLGNRDRLIIQALYTGTTPVVEPVCSTCTRPFNTSISVSTVILVTTDRTSFVSDWAEIANQKGVRLIAYTMLPMDLDNDGKTDTYSGPYGRRSVEAFFREIAQMDLSGNIMVVYSGHGFVLSRGPGLPRHFKFALSAADKGRDSYLSTIDIASFSTRLQERDLGVINYITACHGGTIFEALQPNQWGRIFILGSGPDSTSDAMQRKFLEDIHTMPLGEALVQAFQEGSLGSPVIDANGDLAPNTEADIEIIRRLKFSNE